MCPYILTVHVYFRLFIYAYLKLFQFPSMCIRFATTLQCLNLYIFCYSSIYQPFCSYQSLPVGIYFDVFKEIMHARKYELFPQLKGVTCYD